jgi:hypothetical protein
MRIRPKDSRARPFGSPVRGRASTTPSMGLSLLLSNGDASAGTDSAGLDGGRFTKVTDRKLFVTECQESRFAPNKSVARIPRRPSGALLTRPFRATRQAVVAWHQCRWFVKQPPSNREELGALELAPARSQERQRRSACCPARVTRSASTIVAGGGRRRRTRVHAKAQLRADPSPRPDGRRRGALEIGDEQGAREEPVDTCLRARTGICAGSASWLPVSASSSLRAGFAPQAPCCC